MNSPHPLASLSPDEEILFTRQRHEAEKMGLHWDYRLVHGDKAYSWATKKEMPDPGKATLLFEQPVHTSHYALSQRVDIPSGEYGAGTTTLDFVRKAKISADPDGPEKLVLTTKDGQKFLIKKMKDGKFGDKAWLFKNLTKQATRLLTNTSPNSLLFFTPTYQSTKLIQLSEGQRLLRPSRFVKE
jgi:hypothetical protein